MATFIMLPDSTSGHTLHWAAVGESTHHECLDDDNGDTSYVQCSSDARRIDLGFANPSVAEEDIGSIDSVRFLSSGRCTLGRFGSRVKVSWESPTGNADTNNIYDLHTSNYETINGASLTSSDGSGTAWTYSDLEGASIRLTKVLIPQVRLSYFALEVTYTAPVTVTDNSIFFGSNF